MANWNPPGRSPESVDPRRLRDDFEELRKLAAAYLQWKQAGCPVADEPDTYPSDLWAVYATPEIVLQLLDAARQPLLGSTSCAGNCSNPSWCKTTSKCIQQQQRSSTNGPRSAPLAWWRLSTLPECGPCATTDPDEANEWRAQGLDVRELRELSVLVGELRDALRASHQSLEFMQMLYETDMHELQDDSVRALREALARGEAALAKLPAF